MHESASKEAGHEGWGLNVELRGAAALDLERHVSLRFRLGMWASVGLLRASLYFRGWWLGLQLRFRRGRRSQPERRMLDALQEQATRQGTPVEPLHRARSRSQNGSAEGGGGGEPDTKQ